jgi:hypothetical protein
MRARGSRASAAVNDESTCALFGIQIFEYQLSVFWVHVRC